MTLDDLERVKTPRPALDSYLLQTAYRLRSKPLDEFSTEDLRICIGQSVGLGWLVPIAIQILRRDPLAEGDFYPGDLLSAILTTSRHFWREHPELHAEIVRICSGIQLPEKLDLEFAEFNDAGV